MVFSDLVTELSLHHAIFSHLDQPLSESLILVGKVELFHPK
jgi:hypothetical protein